MQGRGQFITLEGGEGVGKTTLAHELSARLADFNIETILTREPGGCPSAELLRDILYGPQSYLWSPISETLLLYAARAVHLEQIIRPALERGAWVLCDRFNDSTLAYQGAAAAVNSDFLKMLAQYVINGENPSLTFILDLDPAEARRRALQRGDYLSRYDQSPPEFHAALRKAFHKIAADNPDRCCLLNAALEPSLVADHAFAKINERYNLNGLEKS